MKIKIDLSNEEYRGILALAAQCGIAPQIILEQFVADFTYSTRKGGDDECLLAEDYLNRCNYSSPLHGHELTEEQRTEIKETTRRSGRWAQTEITVDLSEEEYRGMRYVAEQCGITIEMILEQFVADLTHSDLTGGSDERLFAENYMMSCTYSSPLHSHYFTDEERKHVDVVAQRSGQLFAGLERYQLLARAEWRTGRSPRTED